MYFRKVFLAVFILFTSVIYKVDAASSHTLTQINSDLFQSKELIISTLKQRLKRNVNKYEIPVTVLYDDVTSKAVAPRKHQLNMEKNNEQSIETINAGKSTVPPQSVKTFPKRPEADSKRIEFQRRSRIRPSIVKILDSHNFVYAHKGDFHYSYDSQDGTKISSKGRLLRNSKNETAGEAVIGSVSYKDDEGKEYSLSYTADENGYQPVGAHLPTPPPIPPAIARALEYLATKKPDLATDY